MTIVGRAGLDHPAYDTAAGGGTLHTSVESLWTQVSDHIPGRVKQYSALANSTLSTYEHGFGVPFEDLRVNIYTGSIGNLTPVTDPVTSGWVIVATSGFLKTRIDVTTPSSGGPHTFVVQVVEAKRDRFLDLHEVAAPDTPPSNTVRVYTKSDGKIYKKDDTGLEQAVGAGGGAGGINYLVSSLKAWDFEDGVSTGWSVYADAAGVSPVDGTGGSPSVTFAASASSPLRGTYSAILTKGASNLQGEGVSVDFTLDAADTGKPFSFSFDSSASSAFTGLSGSESARVYIYDVTNAVLLSGYYDVSPGSSKIQGNFLASTSTSYRFIVHVSGTGTSAWTLKVDNVQIGPVAAIYGFAGTDPVSFTPALSTGSGTLANINTQYYRVGRNLRIIGTVQLGTISANPAYLTLPDGLTYDSSLGGGSNIRGFGLCTLHAAATSGVATGDRIISGYFDGTNADRVYLTYQNNSSGYVANDWTVMALSNNYLVFNLEIPIAQWSSNVQLASRALEEFSYNTDTSTLVSDSTSFAYGPVGFLIGSITASLSRRVRFQTPIQLTDRIIIEVDPSGTGRWQEISNTPSDVTNGRAVQTYNEQNGVIYGIGLRDISSTDVDVVFGQYRIANGATFGAAGGTWAGIPDAKWRVRKVASGASVGFPIVDRNVIKQRENSSVTGTQNDFTFTNPLASVIKFTGSAPVLTGIDSAKVDGFVLTLISATGTSLTINDQDAGSIAANRIITGTGAAVVITTDGSAQLMYDGDSLRWRVISTTA